MIVLHSVEYFVLYPCIVISSPFGGLHVAIPAKAQTHFLYRMARRSVHAFTKDSSVSV
jgi:hypothetical protein